MHVLSVCSDASVSPTAFFRQVVEIRFQDILGRGDQTKTAGLPASGRTAC